MSEPLTPAQRQLLERVLAKHGLDRYTPSEDAGLQLVDTVSTELTGRERQVLILLAGGLSNVAAANGLGISAETVKVHVGHILAKLDARNRTHAVALAYQRGLL